MDSGDSDCDQVDDASVHPDGLYPVCNTTQPISEGKYVDMDGLCPAYNQADAIMQRVHEIRARLQNPSGERLTKEHEGRPAAVLVPMFVNAGELWLILTKRPQLAQERLPDDWDDGYPNVWLGASCGCERSRKVLFDLQTLPASVKFVSAEPLLEPLDLSQHLHWLHWVITGCERAAKDKRRPMDLDWVRSIDQQCRRAGRVHGLHPAQVQSQPLDPRLPQAGGQSLLQRPCRAVRQRPPHGERGEAVVAMGVGGETHPISLV